jgi:hypothetical protein
VSPRRGECRREVKNGGSSAKEEWMSEHDFEELSLWHQVIEDAMNGRTDQLQCPCGEDAPVEAEVDEYRVKVNCTKCGKWIDCVIS